VRALLCLFFVLLSACGGGGGDDTKPIAVAVYGDSLSSGYVSNTRLSPTPVERLTEYSAGAIKAVDYSRDGMTAPEVKIAGNEAMVLLRMGYADAVKGVDESAHTDAMESLIRSLIASGRTPVIAGVLTAPDEHDAAAKRLDDIQRGLASRHGLQFIDVRSLGKVSMGDPIHPDRAGSDRVSLFIAQELVKGLK